MNERKLTKDEVTKRAQIIRDMVKNKRSLVKRYGKEAEKVMYGRATKMAKSHVNPDPMKDPKDLKELIKTVLQTPIVKEEHAKETPESKYIQLMDMYKQANSENKRKIKGELIKAAKNAGIKLQIDEFLGEYSAPTGFYALSRKEQIKKVLDLLNSREEQDDAVIGIKKFSKHRNGFNVTYEMNPNQYDDRDSGFVQGFIYPHELGIKENLNESLTMGFPSKTTEIPGGLKIVISWAPEESRAKIIKNAKSQGYHAARNNGGGVTIMKTAKKSPINEAQKYDVEAVLRSFREFNRGNIDMDHLTHSAIKDLGFPNSKKVFEHVQWHLIASTDEEEENVPKLPMDRAIIYELYPIVDGLNLNEQSDIEVQADNDEEYQNLKKDGNEEEEIVNLLKWYDYPPEQVMTFVYWVKNQIPPTDKEAYDASWSKILLQLQKLSPDPKSISERISNLSKEMKFTENYMGNKGETYMISKSGSKNRPSYVLEKPDGSAQVDMMFSSPEEAKKYADKKGLDVSSKPGYNMKENRFANLAQKLGKNNTPDYPQTFRAQDYVRIQGQTLLPGTYVFNKEHAGKGLYTNPMKKMVVALSHQDLETIKDEIYILGK